MRALFVGGELTAAELLDLLGQRLRLAASLALHGTDQLLDLVDDRLPLLLEVPRYLHDAPRLALRPLVQPRQALDELRGALHELTGGGLEVPQPLGELLPLEAPAVKLLLDVQRQAQVLLELVDPLLAAVDTLLEQVHPLLQLPVPLVQRLDLARDGVVLVLQAQGGLQVAGAAIRELFNLPRQSLVREAKLSHRLLHVAQRLLQELDPAFELAHGARGRLRLLQQRGPLLSLALQVSLLLPADLLATAGEGVLTLLALVR